MTSCEQRIIGGDGQHGIILIGDQPLIARKSRDLDFWMRAMLKSLNEDEVAGRELGEQIVQRGFGRAPQFVHQCPSLPRSNNDLLCSSLAMPMAVLAGDVDIERMVRMLDG